MIELTEEKKSQIIGEIARRCYEMKVKASFTFVGSRETCDPPPDTDVDVLLLCDNLDDMDDVFDGWDEEGALQYKHPSGREGTFVSYRANTFGFEVNVIATENEEFHRKFLLATKVCKKLNLMKREDRVLVFKAILYGRS